MRGLSQGKYPFLVATVEGLLQRTMPRDALERCCRELSVGGVCDLNQLAEDLSAAGAVLLQRLVQLLMAVFQGLGRQLPDLLAQPLEPAGGQLGQDLGLRRLEDFPVVYLDSFTTASYPEPPKALFSVTAKQLPPFLASLEAAVQDLAHYQNSGFASVVLVSGEQRALDLR